MNTKLRIKELLSTKPGIKSIAALERTAGLSNGTINKWDKAVPSSESAQKVADVLNVSVDYLLGNTDDPQKNSSKGPVPLSPEITKAVNKAVQNAQAFDGKPLNEGDMEEMTRLITAWLISGGK